jgi:hypothetical protein
VATSRAEVTGNHRSSCMFPASAGRRVTSVSVSVSPANRTDQLDTRPAIGRHYQANAGRTSRTSCTRTSRNATCDLQIERPRRIRRQPAPTTTGRHAAAGHDWQSRWSHYHGKTRLRSVP